MRAQEEEQDTKKRGKTHGSGAGHSIVQQKMKRWDRAQECETGLRGKQFRQGPKPMTQTNRASHPHCHTLDHMFQSASV